MTALALCIIGRTTLSAANPWAGPTSLGSESECKSCYRCPNTARPDRALCRNTTSLLRRSPGVPPGPIVPALVGGCRPAFFASNRNSAHRRRYPKRGRTTDLRRSHIPSRGIEYTNSASQYYYALRIVTYRTYWPRTENQQRRSSRQLPLLLCRVG